MGNVEILSPFRSCPENLPQFSTLSSKYFSMRSSRRLHTFSHVSKPTKLEEAFQRKRLKRFMLLNKNALNPDIFMIIEYICKLWIDDIFGHNIKRHVLQSQSDPYHIYVINYHLGWTHNCDSSNVHQFYILFVVFFNFSLDLGHAYFK